MNHMAETCCTRNFVPGRPDIEYLRPGTRSSGDWSIRWVFSSLTTSWRHAWSNSLLIVLCTVLNTELVLSASRTSSPSTSSSTFLAPRSVIISSSVISFSWSGVSWAHGLMGSYSSAPEIHRNVWYFTDTRLDRINMSNKIHSIHSIRTYINTTVSLFPTCLVIHYSFIFIGSCQSLSILISSGAKLTITRIVGITLAGPITCSAISFPEAALICTNNSFKLCPSFNLNALERELLYEMRPYRGRFIICAGAYNPIYSASSYSCIKLHFLYRSQTVWFFLATIVFDEINQLLPMPHICVRSLESIAGRPVIVDIWHSTNHNHESCIWQLQEVPADICAAMLSQIGCRLLVASLAHLPRLPNLACTCVQKHHNPLSPNPFGIIKIFQRLQVPKCHQKICNCHLPVQGSIADLVQTGLSLDNGPMLLLHKLCHPDFLLPVEGTKVGLPHPFGKLLQGEFCWLQSDWGIAFGNAQGRRIITHTICIAWVILYLW